MFIAFADEYFIFLPSSGISNLETGGRQPNFTRALAGHGIPQRTTKTTVRPAPQQPAPKPARCHMWAQPATGADAATPSPLLPHCTSAFAICASSQLLGQIGADEIAIGNTAVGITANLRTCRRRNPRRGKKGQKDVDRGGRESEKWECCASTSTFSDLRNFSLSRWRQDLLVGYSRRKEKHSIGRQ